MEIVTSKLIENTLYIYLHGRIDSTNAASVEVMLEKAKEVLRARGEKGVKNAENMKNIVTLYRDGKKRDDGSDGYVRVALKLN